MIDVRTRIFPRRIPDSVRRALYTAAGPVVTLLAAGGLIDGNRAATWTSLALAAVTLVVAIVNCETLWRNAVYAFTAALQVLLQGYGIGTDATWACVTGVVVSLLGIGLAAAFTPSGTTAGASTGSAEPAPSGRHHRPAETRRAGPVPVA